MKVLEIDYTTKLEFSSPVNDHYFLLRCVPVSREGQTVVSRNLSIMPECTLVTGKDIFGNVSYQGRIDFSHKEFSFHSTATVIVDRKNGYRDLCFPLYKYNTTLTSLNDEMREFLYALFDETDLREAVRNKKIRARDFSLVAEVIREAVHKKIKYVPGSTNVKTTVREAFENGEGVCQDYAQIFCGLMREAGIPSRYVAGTSQGEGSTHAWGEFFVPDSGIIESNGSAMQGKWYGVDATRNKNVDDTYVILASGRDYEDCRVDGGIFRGAADQTMTVFVTTREKELNKGKSSEEKNSSLSLEELKKNQRLKNQQQQM